MQQSHKIFIYLDPWKPCGEDEKNRIYDEILLELDPDTHPLVGFHFDILAQNNANDVLVRIENGEFDFAVLSLTWSGKTEAGDLPEITFYVSQEEWAERCMKESA